MPNAELQAAAAEWSIIKGIIRRRFAGKPFVGKMRLIRVAGDTLFIAIERNGRAAWSAQQNRDAVQPIAKRRGFGIIFVVEPDEYERERLIDRGAAGWDQFPAEISQEAMGESEPA